jgi:transcription elongation factor Elf1
MRKFATAFGKKVEELEKEHPDFNINYDCLDFTFTCPVCGAEAKGLYSGPIAAVAICKNCGTTMRS